MTACEAHGPLLQYQSREALPKPGQMRRLQVGVERRPAVVHLVEEDMVGRPFHLDEVEPSAARLVGSERLASSSASARKASIQSGLTTNSGITTNAAGFPGLGMRSVLPCLR